MDEYSGRTTKNEPSHPLWLEGYEGFGICELQVGPWENHFYLNSKLQEVYEKLVRGASYLKRP
jgi:hypothetical protein